MTCILQISSGQGPAECRRFVPLLAEIVRKAAAAGGVSCVPLSEYSAKDEQRASLRFAVEGAALASFRASWEGTVQWIWKSAIRPHWPRKNWFVKVSFFDFRQEDAAGFKPSDLRIESCRASGPGGQHVNTTDSAVRVTHPQRNRLYGERRALAGQKPRNRAPATAGKNGHAG